ncbi:methionyl-tRNA formyltransferase [Flavobacteriaceae bacterium 3-367]|uniref:methionyl-tRNA formyltransferase n=1 Tax=Eudoraea algarum TaxID=3417568 RepID=UPI00327F4B8B
MEKLRIVFMGTPDFAVGTLRRLVQESHTIVGVVTAPDRPAGRGRKLQESAVKKYALEQGLKVLQPTNLKDAAFLEELRSLNANLQIVVAFRMLPQVVWAMPRLGTFNLHASLLPNYRGAAPINWAIMNGENQTGVTTFFIDDKIDTGEIILQENMGIGPEDTAGTLHDKLMHLGAELVLKTVALIEKREVSPRKQENQGQLRSASKIHKETCEINWNKPLHSIYDHIRGLSPYPTAWTTLHNGEESIFLKIYMAKAQKEKHEQQVGALLLDGKELKVAVKNGYIHLLEMQLPGKRRMAVSEILNGWKPVKNAYVS